MTFKGISYKYILSLNINHYRSNVTGPSIINMCVP